MPCLIVPNVPLMALRFCKIPARENIHPTLPYSNMEFPSKTHNRTYFKIRARLRAFNGQVESRLGVDKVLKRKLKALAGCKSVILFSLEFANEVLCHTDEPGSRDPFCGREDAYVTRIGFMDGSSDHRTNDIGYYYQTVSLLRRFHCAVTDFPFPVYSLGSTRGSKVYEPQDHRCPHFGRDRR